MKVFALISVFTPKIITLIEQIGERLGALPVSAEAGNLRLRRIHRIQTIPDKPNSRLQKYRLTEKGKRVLSERDCEK